MQRFTKYKKYLDYRHTSLDWIQSKRSTVALRDQWLCLCEHLREHSQSLSVTHGCKNPNASPSLVKNYEAVYFKLKSVHKQEFSQEAKSFESSKAISQKDSEPKANTTNTEVWEHVNTQDPDIGTALGQPSGSLEKLGEEFERCDLFGAASPDTPEDRFHGRSPQDRRHHPGDTTCLPHAF